MHRADGLSKCCDDSRLNTCNSLFSQFPDLKTNPWDTTDRWNASCTVAVSKPLLPAVILSMALKLATCTVVVCLLGPHQHLATLGDAISSFISVQPKSAFVSGVLTDLAVRDRCRKNIITKPVLPLRWSKKQYRRAGYVPRRVWFRFWGTHMLWLLPVAVLFPMADIHNSSL